MQTEGDTFEKIKTFFFFSLLILVKISLSGFSKGRESLQPKEKTDDMAQVKTSLSRFYPGIRRV
jgi:hypothetical protein